MKKKIFSILALIFSMFFFLTILFSNCSKKAGTEEATTPPRPPDANTPQEQAKAFELMSIIGESNKSGVFDPALEYGPDGTGWMVYSWVHWPDEVVTHLAKSTDQGKTWTYISALNAKSTQDINGKSYVWRYETPTLVYDPTDIESRRWKLYVQRVRALATSCSVLSGCTTDWGESSIWFRYAADPSSNWSNEVCLFGKTSDGCSININGLHPSLSLNKGYNELGSIVRDGTIYLSMDSYTTSNALGDWQNRKMILLSSADHGTTWTFVGDLLTYSDAVQAQYIALTASSLVRVGSTDYLFFSPSGSINGSNKSHDGTWIVEFEDISKAKLKRDDQNQIIVSKKISITKSNGGESDYDEKNTGGGIVFPQLDLTAFPNGLWFQIHNTYQGI